MESILSGARDLAEQIKASPLRSAYLDARAVIDQNPGYSRRLAEYRRLRLRSEGDSDAPGQDGQKPEDPLWRKRQAAAAYRELSANDDLRRFLELERQLVELVCEAVEIIAEAYPESPGDISITE